MKILFIHQSFPGQYIHIVNSLAQDPNNTLIALSINASNQPVPTQVKLIRYTLKRGNGKDTHPLAMETESKVIRAEACAEAAYALKKQGFVPDLICAHPGWGESLFMKDIWPHSPILSYQEFYYAAEGTDCDFDPELQQDSPWEAKAKIRMKNAYLQLALEASTWNVTPTNFQRSSFSNYWQNRISTIHDGIRTDLACPNPKPSAVELPDGTLLQPNKPLITFVNRTLEPYRGCHTFIRAIPHIQDLCPDSNILIVGETEGVSYGSVCPKGEWKDRFMSEIEGNYDPSRVLFSGSLPYKSFLKVMQISQAHVYLTYPFVLSWSLLEAMSSGCAVIGSNTAPVREAIKHGHNGLLVDFFSPVDVAENVALLLKDRALATKLGKAARETVLSHFSLDKCLPHHLSLIKLVASGSLPD